MNQESSGRQFINPRLLAKIDQSDKDGGYFLENIENGVLVKKATRNSLYILTRIAGEKGQVAITGGQHIPRPRVGYLHGSTYGGSMIKVGWIGKGMHLEVALVGGGILTTSAIQEISLEQNPTEAEAMIRLAQDNSPKEMTKEEVEQWIEQFVSENFSDEVRQEARNMIGRFSLNGQVAISGVLALAYKQEKFGKALELLEEFYAEHWAYQPFEIRGDPTFTTKNALYIERAYQELGISK